MRHFLSTLTHLNHDGHGSRGGHGARGGRGHPADGASGDADAHRSGGGAARRPNPYSLT